MRTLLSLALRYQWRHRRLSLVVFVVMLLTTSLLSTLPVYATAVAMRSLRTRLETAPSMRRNLAILASRSYRPNPALLGDLLEPVEDLVAGRMDIRSARLAVDVPYAMEGGIAVTEIRLMSLSRLPERLTVVEGALPEHWVARTRTEELHPPKSEVVASHAAAVLIGLQVGDVITAVSGNEFTVVGLVRPTEPTDEIWFDDLSSFAMQTRAIDTNTDVAILPLITSELSMKNYFVFHTAESRIVLHHDLINVEKAAAIESVLNDMRLTAANAGLQLSSGLFDLLAEYRDDQATSQVTLFLLTAQTGGFALYTLVMLAQFLEVRSRVELAMLGDRGAGRRQITTLFALVFAVLMFPAAVCGPLLGHGALQLFVGDSAIILPRHIPVTAWWLSLSAGSLAWVTLVLAIHIGTRRNLLQATQTRARPPEHAIWQRLGLDLFLLILGGLVYWQLRDTGSAWVTAPGTAGARAVDPVLLLGPSLLLIATAMLFLRIFPLFLRGVGWASNRSRGLVLPLGIQRLARAPEVPSRVILLISLAVGLTLFAKTFSTSLLTRQAEMARYLAGADLRIVRDGTGDDELFALLNNDGGISLTPVLRTVVQSHSQGAIPLLGVDRHSFAAVAAYPKEMTRLTIAGLMDVLAPLSPGSGGGDTDVAAAIPAIFSYDALPYTNLAGEQITLNLNGTELSLLVQGLVINFPTLSGAFIVVDRDALFAVLGEDQAQTIGEHELWIASADASADAPLMERIRDSEGVHVIADADVNRRVMQADALAQSALGAFALNAIALTLLSWIAFLMVNYFAAEQRSYEISILRAGGMSTRQLLALLTMEGLLVMVLGIVSGTAIGIGLAKAMIPALSPIISGALAGVPLVEILVDWRSVAGHYAALVAGYGIAMGLLLNTLWRTGIHRALRLGET